MDALKGLTHLCDGDHVEVEEKGEAPPPPPPPMDLHQGGHQDHPEEGNEDTNKHSSAPLQGSTSDSNVFAKPLPSLPVDGSRPSFLKPIEPTKRKYSPPSPRTARASAEEGRKAVGLGTYLKLHGMVAQYLQPNVRGERDFKALANTVKEQDNSPEMQRLLKNLRQEVKKLYGERRKRKQLVAWDKLEQAVGIRNPATGRNIDVNREKVVERALQVDTIVSKWFMDRSIFDEYFVHELSVHLVALLGRGERSPGSVLNMPPVVTEKIVKLHQDRCKDRFQELHRMFFSDLFTPADIEIAVLSKCNCATCVGDWEVYKIEHRDVDAHVRFHWTKKKAEQAVKLLSCHSEDGPEVGAELTGKGVPMMRSWNESDFKGVLRCVHTCASCHLCQNRHLHRRPIMRMGVGMGLSNLGSGASSMQSLPPSPPEHSSSENHGARAATSTSQSSGMSPVPIIRVKDAPQTRKVGIEDKRRIRQAMAEQYVKAAKTSSDSTPRREIAEASKSDFQHTVLQAALRNSQVLQRLADVGVLSNLGISDADGQRDRSEERDEIVLNESEITLVIASLEADPDVLGQVSEVLNKEFSDLIANVAEQTEQVHEENQMHEHRGLEEEDQMQHEHSLEHDHVDHDIGNMRDEEQLEQSHGDMQGVHQAVQQVQGHDVEQQNLNNHDVEETLDHVVAEGQDHSMEENQVSMGEDRERHLVEGNQSHDDIMDNRGHEMEENQHHEIADTGQTHLDEEDQAPLNDGTQLDLQTSAEMDVEMRKGQEEEEEDGVTYLGRND